MGKLCEDDGTFIPDVIKNLKGLTLSDKVILSEYRSYTLYGKGKDPHCYLKNEVICDEWGMKERNLQTIKSKLKKLGYIKTKGRNVWYLGVPDDKKFFQKVQCIAP